jgi:hypothetical protein
MNLKPANSHEHHAAAHMPLWMTGRFPATHAITTVLFGLVVVGDLIAIPFRYVFAKPSPT